MQEEQTKGLHLHNTVKLHRSSQPTTCIHSKMYINIVDIQCFQYFKIVSTTRQQDDVFIRYRQPQKGIYLIPLGRKGFCFANY